MYLFYLTVFLISSTRGKENNVQQLIFSYVVVRGNTCSTPAAQCGVGVYLLVGCC